MRFNPLFLPVCLLKAELAVTVVGGFLLVPGTIDGNPVSFIVHTAAAQSLVDSGLAARLQLDRSGRQMARVQGLGGNVTAPIVRVPSFGVGRIEMLDRIMVAVPLPMEPSLDPPIGGVLGRDFLTFRAGR